MSDSLFTIRVTGRSEFVSVSAFVSVVQNTLEILHGLDIAISENPSGVLEWRIAEVSLNSPLTMTIFAEAEDETGVDRQVVSAYSEGLEHLDKDGETVPTYFNDALLEKARKLVSVLNDGVAKIAFVSSWTDPVEPSQRVAAHVDRLLPPDHEEWGSIEGKLEVLSIHGGASFNIWNVISGARVTCRIPSEMLDEAHAAFGKRTAVQGKIRYDRRGKPVSISVHHIRILREQSELPQSRDLEGIDITGGIDPVEHVRRLRDGD
jgi:hypothetical protein